MMHVPIRTFGLNPYGNWERIKPIVDRDKEIVIGIAMFSLIVIGTMVYSIVLGRRLLPLYFDSIVSVGDYYRFTSNQYCFGRRLLPLYFDHSMRHRNLSYHRCSANSFCYTGSHRNPRCSCGILVVLFSAVYLMLSSRLRPLRNRLQVGNGTTRKQIRLDGDIEWSLTTFPIHSLPCSTSKVGRRITFQAETVDIKMNGIHTRVRTDKSSPSCGAPRAAIAQSGRALPW